MLTYPSFHLQTSYHFNQHYPWMANHHQFQMFFALHPSKYDSQLQVGKILVLAFWWSWKYSCPLLQICYLSHAHCHSLNHCSINFHLTSMTIMFSHLWHKWQLFQHMNIRRIYHKDGGLREKENVFEGKRKSDLKEIARMVTKKQEEQPIHPRQQDEWVRYHADYIVLNPAICHDVFRQVLWYECHVSMTLLVEHDTNGTNTTTTQNRVKKIMKIEPRTLLGTTNISTSLPNT